MCFKSHRDKVQINALVVKVNSFKVSNPIGTKFKYHHAQCCHHLHLVSNPIGTKFKYLVRCTAIEETTVSNPIGTKFKFIYANNSTKLYVLVSNPIGTKFKSFY